VGSGKQAEHGQEPPAAHWDTRKNFKNTKTHPKPNQTPHREHNQKT